MRSRAALTTRDALGGGGVARPLVCILCALMLAACSSASTTQQPTPSAPSPTATSLPIGCPDPTTPTILPGAKLTLDRDSGPVGTALGVHATGLQPGCHLWLGLTVAPILAETGGTPIPYPRIADEAQQWIAVSAAGTVDTSLCVCEAIPTYTIGYPPYESITPTTDAGGGNMGVYFPKPYDYFFLSIAGDGIPNPPPLYVRFSVTG